MRIFKSLKSKLVLLSTILLAALIPVVATAVATWGPSRPTFDWNDPAHYPRHVVFNSFTNNPTWGDERFVIKGRDVSDAATNLRTNLNVTDNQLLSLVVYFHNDAATDANKTAHNTKVNIELPSGAATTQSVKGAISASNANPREVWSTMDLVGTEPFTLEYETGSARMSNAVFTSGTPLSDNIVKGGTLVGFNQVDGNVPGCSEFSGYALIHVRVHKQVQPNPEFACTLLNLEVKPNRTVNATVTFSAKNGATFKNVTFDWGDNTTPLLTTSTSASHTYAKDGNYTVNATLRFNVGETEKTAACSKSVTFTTPPPTTPPPTTPPPSSPPPAALPNTGPGSIAATFAGVSTFAGLFHYLVRRKIHNL